MKQFAFLQEGSNRILSNLHILWIMFCKATLNLQESGKSIKYIKSYKQNNFIILFNLFSIYNTFEFKVTQIFR